MIRTCEYSELRIEKSTYASLQGAYPGRRLGHEYSGLYSVCSYLRKNVRKLLICKEKADLLALALAMGRTQNPAAMATTAGLTRDTPCEAATHFGELMYHLRTRGCMSQRELARRACIAPSILSETENERRIAPTPEKVDAICDALRASDIERTALHRLAVVDRQACSLKIGRETPGHVAELLREIARMAPQLSCRHVAAIRSSLREAAM